MRTIMPAVILSAALAAGACASGPPSEGSYADQERKLAEDCRARGGILTPTGQTSNQPQIDNVCRISGPVGRAASDR